MDSHQQLYPRTKPESHVSSKSSNHVHTSMKGNKSIKSPAGGNAQSNKLKSRVDFDRPSDSFHIPLY